MRRFAFWLIRKTSADEALHLRPTQHLSVRSRRPRDARAGRSVAHVPRRDVYVSALRAVRREEHETVRHRARSDPNHRELVAAFKSFGFAVRTVKWPADAVIAKAGRMAFVEFKRDEKARLTRDQVGLFEAGFPIYIVISPEDVEFIAKTWL